MLYKEKIIIPEIIQKLKSLFEEHKILGQFSESKAFMSYVMDGVFISESGFKIFIDVKNVISAQTIERYRESAEKARAAGNFILLASQNISQTLLDRFPDSGILFFSLDGASRIEIPGFCYIVKMISRKSEKRVGSSGTVFVGKATFLPRAFLAYPHKKWSQADLSSTLNINRGYISILLRKMIDKGYIIEEDGNYCLMDADKMIDDWDKVYRFDRCVRRQSFAMNYKNFNDGVHRLSEILNNASVHHAFMGGAGAFLRSPYMEQNVLSVYVDRIPEKMDGVYPVDKDGNVVMYVPANEGFFLGEQECEGIPVVSDVQLYLDLRKMPGRSEDQAAYLRDEKMNGAKNA